MFKIPMIGEPLLIKKKISFCEHKLLPITQLDIYQNPAIRIKKMSRLLTLGEHEQCTCRECNEYVCASVWSKYDQKPPPLNERNVLKSKVPSIPREYKVGKGWRLRNQILEKFCENFRCTGNQQKDNNNLLKSKDSVVWLLRPTKKLRESNTNIMGLDDSIIETSIIRPRSKLTQLPQRMHQKSMPYKYQFNPHSTGYLSSRTVMYNWQQRLARQHATNERIAIQKGTKEYFNNCKRRHQIKLMESQLERALYSHNSSYIERRRTPAAQYLSYTKIKELDSLEKLFEQQQNQLLGIRDLDSKECLDEIFGTCSLNSGIEHFSGEDLPKCSCEHCKLRANNIEESEQEQEPSYTDETLEMASSSSSENAGTYDICKSGTICDYMWLKRTDTQIKISNPPKEGIQTSTQTSQTTVVAQESTSRTSMNVNFSESCTRMADFESEMGPDEESELAKDVTITKEVKLAKAEELTKELRAAPEEKEATSMTTLDEDKADGTTTSKSKKMHTKKHKHKKFKNTRTKKQRTQPPKATNKTTIETLKSIENVIDSESNEIESVSPDESQLYNIDCSSSYKDLSSLQGTTRESIKNESYNISYHKPIKYEQKRLFGIYSKKYADLD